MQQPSLNVAPLLRPLLQGITDCDLGCRAKLHSQVRHSCHTHPRPSRRHDTPLRPSPRHTNALAIPYTFAALSWGPDPLTHIPPPPPPGVSMLLKYCILAIAVSYYVLLPYLFLACPHIPASLLQHLPAIVCQIAHYKALAINHTSTACHTCSCSKIASHPMIFFFNHMPCLQGQVRTLTNPCHTKGHALPGQSPQSI